jgi:hypothetical protein
MYGPVINCGEPPKSAPGWPLTPAAVSVGRDPPADDHDAPAGPESAHDEIGFPAPTPASESFFNQVLLLLDSTRL